MGRANQGPYSKGARGITPNTRVVAYQSNIYGMVQNIAESFLAKGQAVDIVNMHSLEEGSWTADSAGYSVLNQSGLAFESGAGVTGMGWFADSNEIDHLLIAINGKIEEIDMGSGVNTLIDNSVSYGANVDFQQFQGAMYLADGVQNAPRKYDGTTVTDCGGWPVSDGVNTFTKPKFLEKHQNRLASMNFDGYPSHLILSDLLDAETYTLIGAKSNGAIVTEVGPGDGQHIVGAKSIHVPLTNETQLIIFKNRSTYALLGTSAQPNDLLNLHVLVQVNDTYGAINNDCIVQVGNDIYALNLFGVTTFTASTQGGTIQPLGINSDSVVGVLSRINKEFVESVAWGVHLPHRREVWFFIPTGSSSVCNEAIIFKYPSPGASGQVPKWSRRTDSNGKFQMAKGILVQKEFYVGSYNGIIGHMFQSSMYANTGIPWGYEWPDDSFGNDKQSKRLRGAASLYFNIRSAQQINIESRWTYGGNNDITSQTISVDSVSSNAKFGQSHYGVDKYGERGEVKVDFQFLGDGIRLKHKISGTTNDSGPELLGITMELESLGLNNNYN